MKSFLQLVSQRLLRDKLQEKLPRVTWPIGNKMVLFIAFISKGCLFLGRRLSPLILTGVKMQGKTVISSR